MGYLLKMVMIIFMIDAGLFAGGFKVINDSSTNVLGQVIDLTSLNQTTNTVNPNTNGLITAVPQNQTFLQQIGSSFGALFTPVIFLFNIVTFLINFFFAPFAIFNIAGVPFMIKLMVGGGFSIAWVIIILSLLSGRDV